MNSASADPRASVAVRVVQRVGRHRGLGCGLPGRDGVGVLPVEVGEGLAGDVEDVAPAADLVRDVDDGHDDHDVDQRVLHERDQRRRAQPAGVGVGRQDGERDEQRQVLGEPVVALLADPHHLQHDLHADQLEGDVGHRGQDPGQRDGQRERPAVVAALDEVGRRDVPVPVADRPQPGQEQEDDRVDDDRVRHREEADRAAGVQRRGHRDERVRRVDVAADEEPRDEGAEAAAAQPPLVQAGQVLRAAPARGREAEHGDQQEQEDEDAERDPVHLIGLHRVVLVVRRTLVTLGELVGGDGQHRGHQDEQELEPEVEREAPELGVVAVVDADQERQHDGRDEQDDDDRPAGALGHFPPPRVGSRRPTLTRPMSARHGPGLLLP